MFKRAFVRVKKFSETWTGSVLIVLVFINFAFQSFVIPSSSMEPTLQVGDFVIVKKFEYGTPIPHLPWLEVPLLPDYDGDGHIIKGEGPSRGDIVVFRYPKDVKTHYVKRCVAKGGDILFLEDKNLFIHFSEGDEFILREYAGYEVYKDSKYGYFVKNPYGKEYTIKHNPEVSVDSYKKMLQNREVMKDQYGYSDEKISLYKNMLEFPNENGPVNGTALVVGDRAMLEVSDGFFFMMGDNRDNSYDSRFWGGVEYKHVEGSVSAIWFSFNSKEGLPRFSRLMSVPE